MTQNIQAYFQSVRMENVNVAFCAPLRPEWKYDLYFSDILFTYFFFLSDLIVQKKEGW